MHKELYEEISPKSHIANVFTIDDLLITKTMRNSMTKLSKFLNKNRGTLTKYHSESCKEYHCILFVDGKFKFLS